MRTPAPKLPELTMAQWAEFARQPMSAAERAFLELQTSRGYAAWCEKSRQSWTAQR
jgi:hypothetical protein